MVELEALFGLNQVREIYGIWCVYLCFKKEVVISNL